MTLSALAANERPAMAPTRSTRRRTHPGLLRVLLATIVGMTLVASACSDDIDTPTADPIEQSSSQTGAEEPAVASTDEGGITSVDEDQLAAELGALPDTTLAQTDADAVAFMREEEKLALDVYRALYDVWGLRMFDNIANAEQTHTESVRALLIRHDLPDPALDQPAGVFTNPDLQVLYDELLARGSESLTEALLVGALIEDLDIADLQARASNDPAVALVFSNLERGSRNHLRAFIGQLDRRNATYTPAYISQADFDAIVNSPTERGNH